MPSRKNPTTIGRRLKKADAGLNSYITKPINIAELTAILKEALQGQTFFREETER